MMHCRGLFGILEGIVRVFTNLRIKRMFRCLQMRVIKSFIVWGLIVFNILKRYWDKIITKNKFKKSKYKF